MLPVLFSPIVIESHEPHCVCLAVQLLPEDKISAEEHARLFPQGKTDVNEQQIDLRRNNSWLLKLHEVRPGGREQEVGSGQQGVGSGQQEVACFGCSAAASPRAARLA